MKTATTDAEGHAVFELDVGAAGFRGYVEVAAADRLPTLLFWEPLLTGNPEIIGWGILTWPEVDAFTEALGTPQDHGLGMLRILALDCGDDPAAGVTVQLSDTTASVVYLRSGKPVVSADRTDASGVTLVLNAKPGLPDITVTHADTERRVATTAARVRAGTVTMVMLSPTE